MRVRMFQPRFAELVRSGVKRQTVRPMPKRLPKVGDRESWRQWTGRPYNSPQRELAQVVITRVSPVILNDFGVGPAACIAGRFLPPTEWQDFAEKDGFSSPGEMLDWFDKNHGLPFSGILIEAK